VLEDALLLEALLALSTDALGLDPHVLLVAIGLPAELASPAIAFRRFPRVGFADFVHAKLHVLRHDDLHLRDFVLGSLDDLILQLDCCLELPNVSFGHG